MIILAQNSPENLAKSNLLTLLVNNFRTQHKYLVFDFYVVSTSLSLFLTREKGRGAMWQRTGSCFSLVLLERGWRGRHNSTQVEGIDRVKVGWRASPPSASWTENTLKGGFFLFLCVLYSTLLHFADLQIIHCLGGRWDRTPQKTPSSLKVREKGGWDLQSLLCGLNQLHHP